MVCFFVVFCSLRCVMPKRTCTTTEVFFPFVNLDVVYNDQFKCLKLCQRIIEMCFKLKHWHYYFHFLLLFLICTLVYVFFEPWNRRYASRKPSRNSVLYLSLALPGAVRNWFGEQLRISCSENSFRLLAKDDFAVPKPRLEADLPLAARNSRPDLATMKELDQ